MVQSPGGLSITKEYNPVKVVDCGKARIVADEPAFVWWILFTLRQRGRISVAINSRIKKSTHKPSIVFFTSLKHILKQDQQMKQDHLFTKYYQV